MKQYNISYLENLDKEYMGSDVYDYINSKNGKCTLAEFFDAGKIWANDKMSNDEFTEEEFNDVIEYYDSFWTTILWYRILKNLYIDLTHYNKNK